MHLQLLVCFYVGYKAKNMKWGAILGAIAATPLFVLAAYGVFGPLSDSSVDPQVTMLITLIVVLIVGALVGFVGAYTYRNRQRAIAAKEKQAKIGKKKKEKNNLKLLFFPILFFNRIFNFKGYSSTHTHRFSISQITVR